MKVPEEAGAGGGSRPGHEGAPSPSPVQVAGAVPLGAFYAFHFASVGILLPFLPAYLRSTGLRASEVGLLLAIQPFVSLVGPSLWGAWADRSGRPDRVLSVLAFGAWAGFLPLLLAQQFWALACAIALYATFSTSITTLADTLTLHRVSLTGGAYAKIRLFGSVGFVASSTCYGLFSSDVNKGAVLIPAVLLAFSALSSLAIRARMAMPTIGAVALPTSSTLLRDRALLLLLCATALHWIASAPFNGSYALYVLDLGLEPWVVGVSAGLGVLAEVAVMALSPQLGAKVGTRGLLYLAFGGSALRWWGMSFARSPEALLALSLLHGLTFGAFYVGAVALVANSVAPELRARGQGLFTSVTFGLGGIVGYLSAGAGYEWLRGPRLFGAAGLVELLAIAFLLKSKVGSAAVSARPP